MIARFTSLVVLLACLCTTARSQGYFEPDSTYGINGIAMPQTTTSAVWLHHMLGSTLQPDGKLLVAGTGNFQNTLEVARLNINGSLDTSFNHTGFTNLVANGIGGWKFIGVRIGPSGNIMLGYYSENLGNTRYTVLCLQADGAINTAYGVGGKAEIGPSLAGNELILSWMEVQDDGKVVLAGGGPDAMMTHKYLLARLKTNGTPDSTFGINGLAKCPFLAGENRHMQLFTFRIQTDGKILAAGTIPPGAAGNPDTLVLVRYLANGTLDPAYGTGGIAKYEDRLEAGAMRIDAAGNTYLVGRIGLVYSPDTFYIKKFSPTGSPVTSFGTGGQVMVDAHLTVWNDHEQLTFPGRFELLADGRMIVVGTSDSSATSEFRLCRLLADGTMDATFAPAGTITANNGYRDYCSDVQVQADGRVVLTGFYRTGEGTFDTARILAMRFRDTAFTTPTTSVPMQHLVKAAVYPNPAIAGVFTWQYHNSGAAMPASYTVSTVTGQVVAGGTMDMAAGDGSETFDYGALLSPGVYTLRISWAQGCTTYKVVMGGR